MTPRWEGHDVKKKKKISTSDNQGYTKNACTKFLEKILNS